MDALNQKVNELFPGKVVRKDLTKLVKGNAIVPTYVLEYLLGQYCATDDEETIFAGIETVRSVLAQHFVHRDEANLIKSNIKEKGSFRIIDKVAVRLNDTKGVYEATFSNLGLSKVLVDAQTIKNHKKLLSAGVWCIVNLSYLLSEEHGISPWIIDNLKLIQVSNSDVAEYKEKRRAFTTAEWIDFLIRSVGLNPDEFNDRTKLIQLSRLIPFCENNYNFMELGPKGTGKSHIYSEMSPHGILVSGGEVSKAKLFVNNANGDIGLVGYWDVVAYDEFAGKGKRVDKGLVDIMKNYMANKSFSRGTDTFGAAASMAFVGNTDHPVAYMLKHANLFEALPKEYYDTAFLDRVHAYIPGWEVQKLRNDMFTSAYGFIVDYLAEILKELRKEDFSHHYQQFFKLSDSVTTRDKDAIAKTYSGLVKVIYPHGELTDQEAIQLMDFAVECRKRVKQQLIKMDETFEQVDFAYKINATGLKRPVDTLEEIIHGMTGSGNTDQTGGLLPVAGTVEASEIAGVPPTAHEATEGQFLIRDNQSGVSYRALFASYLAGASTITIKDPFIRMGHQMRNFMELCTVVAHTKADDQEVNIHLVTNNVEEYLQDALQSFKEMADSLEESGIYLTYEFDGSLHDRSIVTDTGWKVVLGRGLDIFQKSRGRFDISEFDQEKRLCKACEITYLKVT